LKALIRPGLRQLNAFMGVRGGEWSILLLMITHLFLTLSTQSMLRSLNTGLFLGAFGASVYPWYFLAESILTLALSMIYSTWVVGRIDRKIETLGFLLLFIFVLIAGRLLLFQEAPWVRFVLPMFCDSMIGILMIQTWSIYGDCLDSRKAKRLYPLIGFGGTCGAISGGWLASSLVNSLGTENLLFVGVAVLSLLMFIGMIIQNRYMNPMTTTSTRFKDEDEVDGFLQSVKDFFTGIFGNRLLLLMILVLIGVRIASTIGDFHLQVQLKQTFQQNEITAYIGSYLAITNLCMLVVQALVENRLINAYGVVFGMASTPIALTLGLGNFLISPSLFSITVTKFFEQLTRNSIFKTSVELVYLPFDSARRRKLRLRVNALLGLATVPCVSLAIVVMNGEQLPLTILALTFALAGIVISLELKKPYTQSLHQSLMRRRLLVDEEEGSPVQLSSARIEESLAQDNTEMVLFALELLKNNELNLPHDQILPLLEHDNPFVREGALHILRRLNNPDYVDTILHMLKRERVGRVRKACFKVLQQIGDENLNVIAISHLGDSDLEVQAEATVFLFTRGGIEGVLAGAEHLKHLMGSEDPVELKASARIMGSIGVRYFRKDFLALMESPWPEVRQTCLVAAGISPEPTLLPVLFRCLQDSKTAREALGSLCRYPAELILPQVVKEFRKSSSSHEYRSELIRLMGSFLTAQTAGYLLEVMQEPHVRLKYQALTACANLRRKLTLDLSEFNHIIYYQIQREFRYGYSYYFLISLIQDNPIHAERAKLLIDELSQRIGFVQNMLFKLFALIYHPNEMYKAYLNFKSQAPHYRALSLEVLNYTLGRDLVDVALTLLDDLPMEKRLSVARDRAFIDDYIGESWWSSTFIQEDIWLNRIATWVRDLNPSNEEENAVFHLLDKVFLLKKTPLFKGFQANELTPVAQAAEEVLLAAQTRVFRQGAPGDAFFVISKGEVVVERNGREVVRLGEGECFGEVEILNASPRLATIRTLSNCEFLRISREDFIDVVETYPLFARGLLEILSKRLGDNLTQVEQYLPESTSGKA
jgi:ATP:ADP antiporter, AAA family